MKQKLGVKIFKTFKSKKERMVVKKKKRKKNLGKQMLIN